MDVDGLRALEQAATPGPWRSHGDHWIFDAEDQAVFAGAMMVTDDAEFIVAARNALPGLLARVAAAEAERDAYREALRDGIDHGETIELAAWCALVLDRVGRAVLAAPVPSGPAEEDT